MGSFFSNVQLRVSNIDKLLVLEKAIECITKLNDAAGFIRVESEDDADKTVIISQSDEFPWLAIYDEELEDQGSGKLNKLASELSKQFKTTALSVLVHDSDSLYVGLSINGVLKDKISNLSKKTDLNTSKPDAWSEILSKNHSFEDIKTAWFKENIIVEDFLFEFAQLIDLDALKLVTGYEYLHQEEPNEGIKLNFAKKEPKKAAELGLTKFSMMAGASLITVKSGEKQTLNWMLTNYGTSSKGLEIIVMGQCIDEDILIPESTTISYSKFKSDNQDEFLVPFIESTATSGKKIFYIKIDDIVIPEGFQPIYPMSPKQAKKYNLFLQDSLLQFKISFIGKKEDNGNLDIFFIPINNRLEGSYYASLKKGDLSDWIAENT